MRAGYIGLVGRPNVGKSTLLNHILGQKIAIASPRPQTTRNRILGVKNLPGAQMVLLDTPGLHRPAGKGRSRLNQFMAGEALSVLEEVDALVVLVESPDGGELKRSPHFRLDPAQKWRLKPALRLYDLYAAAADGNGRLGLAALVRARSTDPALLARATLWSDPSRAAHPRMWRTVGPDHRPLGIYLVGA